MFTVRDFFKYIVFSLYKPLFISLSDLGSAATLGIVDFDGPDQPAAPDYTGAAEATAAGNLAMARETVEANRVNQTTPWGASTWTQPTTEGGQWSQATTLSPEQQNLYNLNTQTNTGMAETGLAALGSTKGMFETPMDFSGVSPAATYQGPGGSTPSINMPQGSAPSYQGLTDSMPTYGDTKQRVMDALMSRTTTDVGRQRESTSAQLISQGIPKGSEAYNREMEQLDRRLTDAKQQAEITGTNLAGQEYQSALAGREMQNKEANTQFLNDITSRGLQGAEAQQVFTAEMQRRGMSTQEAEIAYKNAMSSRQQGITEALTLRNQPLNELNAFRTGNQVSMPQFAPVPQQETTLGPDYMGATTATGNWNLAGWNAEQAQNNAIMGGLFQLGGAAIGAG